MKKLSLIVVYANEKGRKASFNHLKPKRYYASLPFKCPEVPIHQTQTRLTVNTQIEFNLECLHFGISRYHFYSSYLLGKYLKDKVDLFECTEFKTKDMFFICIQYAFKQHYLFLTEEALCRFTIGYLILFRTCPLIIGIRHELTERHQMYLESRTY